LNSANAAIAGGYTDILGNVIPGTDATPRDFYDGFFKATQMTANIDINRDVEVGFGGSVERCVRRRVIGATRTRSVRAIRIPILAVARSPTPVSNRPMPAFTPAKTTPATLICPRNRSSSCGWTWRAGLKHYDDFGSKTVGKLNRLATTSFPEFAVRGTISTGFRAPTLAEEYYRATNVSPDSATVQLQPNSKAAADLGLGGLKPETSRNYSIGLAMQPAPGLTATIDAYWIDINNRIVASETFELGGQWHRGQPGHRNSHRGFGRGTPSLVVPGGSYSVSLFTNGIDTRTKRGGFCADAPFDYGWSKLRCNYRCRW